jgi:protein SCO1/2
VVVGALALGACGGERATTTAAVLNGQVRTPPTDVGALRLPEAGATSSFAFKATNGHVLLVYFGYTSCPDVCPTTLTDVKAALNKLASEHTRVDLAMITIDPTRDSATKLHDYVQSFVAGAHALRADDDTQLRAVADAFGAAYSVTKTAAGDEEVGHSAFLYAVDDQGHLRVQWPFGVHGPDLAADLHTLLLQIDKETTS